MKSATVLILLTVLIVYVVFGALVFYFIEKDEEKRIIKEARAFHKHFLGK